MTSFIALRQASRRDASELAILADIASRGFASWLWVAGVENGVSDTPLERGRLKMSEEEAVGSWRMPSLPRPMARSLVWRSAMRWVRG